MKTLGGPGIPRLEPFLFDGRDKLDSILNSCAKMSERPSVFVTRGIPHSVLNTLEQFSSVCMYDESKGMLIPREELLKRVKGINAIFIHPPDKLDIQLLDAAGDSSLICSIVSILSNNNP